MLKHFPFSDCDSIREVTKGMLALLSSSVDYEPVENAKGREVSCSPQEWLASRSTVYACAAYDRSDSPDHFTIVTDRVPYLWLARTFVDIEQYTARTDIIRLLTNMFRSVITLSPNDLLSCVYLTINKVDPSLRVPLPAWLIVIDCLLLFLFKDRAVVRRPRAGHR